MIGDGNFISQVPLFGGLDDAQQVSLQQKMGHTTLRRPFAAHTALRGFSAARKISREERRLLSEPVRVPVLSLVGRDDGAWSALDHAADAQFVDAPLTQIVIREAGHFLPEEAPQAVAQALSDHVEAHAK